VLNGEDKNILKNAAGVASKKIFFSPDCKDMSSGNRAYVEDNRISLDIDKKKVDICGTDDLKIKGRHNQANALAAAAAAYAFGVNAGDIAEAMKTFKGLPHRCQQIALINGIRFINDSKSTTVDAAIKALSLCDSRAVLIAGGRDKNSDFSAMRRHLKGKVKTLILIGESRGKIKNALSGSVDIKESDSLEEAVESAFGIAKRGESVLFSPMCTSFDMFENFEHRGRVFTDAVMRLKKRCASQG
jgi:UDP-N-acetylmuramoylalanine--D-glutamate ligase